MNRCVKRYGAVNASVALALLIGFLVVGIGAAPVYGADAYPSKPITLIVPMAPGGTTDLGARVLAEALEKELKVSVVVVNKPGGAMTVGGYATASAKPDGYTLGFLAGSGAHPEVYSYFYSAPYSSADLKPVACVQTVLLTITAKGDAPWNNLKDLIEYARKNPRTKYGTHGKSTTGYVVLTTIGKIEKISFVDLDYDSDAQITAALLGGHVSFGTPAFSSIKSLREAKKLKVFATLTEKRADFAPDIPTVEECGYKLPNVGFNGVFASKETPDAIVKRLDDAIRKVMAEKEFQAKARNLDMLLDYRNPANFQKLVTRNKESLISFFKDEGFVKK